MKMIGIFEGKRDENYIPFLKETIKINWSLVEKAQIFFFNEKSKFKKKYWKNNLI